jgi:hypothetical protein
MAGQPPEKLSFFIFVIFHLGAYVGPGYRRTLLSFFTLVLTYLHACLLAYLLAFVHSFIDH